MLKVSALSLEQLRDSFQTLYIVGSGPTEFDYSFLDIHDPIIFINDAVRFAEQCPSKHRFFITHHLSKYQDVLPVTFWLYKAYFMNAEWSIAAENRHTPKNEAIPVKIQMGDEYSKDFFAEHAWLFDKDEVVKRNTILALFGTVTSALYISWFCGCLTPRLIGCNPDTLTDQHDSRIGGAMIHEPEKIKRNQKELTQKLGINPIYL